MNSTCFFALVLICVLWLHAEARTELRFEKWCAEKSNGSEFTDIAISQDGNRTENPIVTIKGSIRCATRQSFCALTYTTMRHPEHGAICPFADTQSLMCTNTGVLWYDRQIRMNEKDGHLMNGTYDINMEFFSDCAGEKIIHKVVSSVGEFNRDAGDFHAQYSIDLANKGTTDYSVEQIERFHFFRHTANGLTVQFVRKLDSLYIDGKIRNYSIY